MSCRLAVFFFYFHFAGAYQGGAPCSQVGSLQPGPPHGNAQTSPSPYAIRVLNRAGQLVSGNYVPSETYVVEIYARCGTWTSIRGFLVVAKDSSGAVVGEFLKDDSNYWQAVQYACPDKKGSVTHYVAYDRTQPVQFYWQLGDHSDKNVRFEATVVQSFHKYWKGLTWPDSATENCRCEDNKTYDCAGYAKSNQCNTPSVRDNCVFTCNNCSTLIH